MKNMKVPTFRLYVIEGKKDSEEYLNLIFGKKERTLKTCHSYSKRGCINLLEDPMWWDILDNDIILMVSYSDLYSYLFKKDTIKRYIEFKDIKKLAFKSISGKLLNKQKQEKNNGKT